MIAVVAESEPPGTNRGWSLDGGRDWVRGDKDPWIPEGLSKLRVAGRGEEVGGASGGALEASAGRYELLLRADM